MRLRILPIIEQKEAIENIEEIAAIPGIDVLFIGAQVVISGLCDSQRQRCSGSSCSRMVKAV